MDWRINSKMFDLEMLEYWNTFLPNSGRLATLFGILEAPGACSPGKKIRNLRSSNCWKCIEVVNPTITTLLLYHFKSLTIPSGGPFWLLGGAPPAYGPEYIIIEVLICASIRRSMHLRTSITSDEFWVTSSFFRFCFVLV